MHCHGLAHAGQFLGLDGMLGAIRKDYRADLVAFGAGFIVTDTWVAGCGHAMDEQRLSQFGEGANTKRCFGCAEGKPPTKFPSRAAAQQTQSLFCKTTSLSFFSRRLSIPPKLWRFGTMEVVKGRRIGLLRMMNGSDANGKSAAYLA